MTAGAMTMNPNPSLFIEDLRRVCEKHGLTFFFGSDARYHIITLDDEEKNALDGPFGMAPTDVVPD